MRAVVLHRMAVINVQDCSAENHGVPGISVGDDDDLMMNDGSCHAVVEHELGLLMIGESQNWSDTELLNVHCKKDVHGFDMNTY
ncbi:hypothetical protein [Aeromonas media]|uniref:hypothetical protein n=1 Tax=Aeromonas media TaxID=651 RepID=UPI003D1C8E52